MLLRETGATDFAIKSITRDHATGDITLTWDAAIGVAYGLEAVKNLGDEWLELSDGIDSDTGEASLVGRLPFLLGTRSDSTASRSWIRQIVSDLAPRFIRQNCRQIVVLMIVALWLLKPTGAPAEINFRLVDTGNPACPSPMSRQGSRSLPSRVMTGHASGGD